LVNVFVKSLTSLAGDGFAGITFSICAFAQNTKNKHDMITRIFFKALNLSKHNIIRQFIPIGITIKREMYM
jgi:hypothetical protein